MPEPVSITAIITLLATTTKLCAQILRQLVTAITQIRNVGKELQLLKDEVTGLKILLKAFQTMLNDDSLGFREMYVQKKSCRDTWKAVYHAVNKLEQYLQDLRGVLSDIGGKELHRTFFGRCRQAFQLQNRKSEIAGLRETLGQHHLTLNTALNLVQMYPRGEQPARGRSHLMPQAQSLTRWVREVPLRGSHDVKLAALRATSKARNFEKSDPFDAHGSSINRG